jgi:hypothetical protein
VEFTGSLNTPRGQHTATLLPNGQVLVTGGLGNILAPNSAELYDPARGTWSVTGSLNTPRSGHTATLLLNGTVLVIGGDGGHNSVELYDPATGTWSVTGSLNTPRSGHTATLLHNGQVLVTGGFGASNSAELYDPVKGTWSITASLNTRRAGYSATLLPNGKVLVAGGSDGPSYLNSAELYDPLTGTWNFTANLNTPRAGHTATLLPEGKVLAVGGANNDFPIRHLNSAELYDFPSPLKAAILPSSRSVQIGSPASAFATVINAGKELATSCAISPVTAIPATLTYQTTDPATNQITGFGNTPVDIPAGAAQNFVFLLTPTAPIAPTDVQFSFECTNSNPAPIHSGVNTLLFSSATAPVPDIVALAATRNNDGIVNIPGTNGTGVFALATVNMGAGDTFAVLADTGGAILPVNVFVCQTAPQSGACLSPPATSVPITILSNETPTPGVLCPPKEIFPFSRSFIESLYGSKTVAVSREA